MLKKIALSLIVSLLALSAGCASRPEAKSQSVAESSELAQAATPLAAAPTTPTGTSEQPKEQEFKGSFSGHETASYVIEGKKGQVFTFELDTKNTQAYVNVYAPGQAPGESEPLINGPSTGTEVTFVLPQDGTYTLQVFQMAANARRDASVQFELETKLMSVDALGHVLGDDDQLLQVQGVETLPLYPTPNAPGDGPLLLLAERAIVEVKTCETKQSTLWCEVEVDGGKAGWVQKEHLKPPVLPPTSAS